MAVNVNKIHQASLTLNERVASFFADVLGSPWTIYVFAAIAFISLPDVLASRSLETIVSWCTQTFIQLVALAVLQSKAVLDSKHAEILANETHKNAELAEQNAEEIKEMLITFLQSQGTVILK